MSEDKFTKYPGGPLDSDEQGTMIGGTHHVSTKIDKAAAERGEYTPINGDSMPSGTPTEGPPMGSPYFPKN